MSGWKKKISGFLFFLSDNFPKISSNQNTVLKNQNCISVKIVLVALQKSILFEFSKCPAGQKKYPAFYFFCPIVNDKKRFKKMFLSKLFLENQFFFSFFKHLIYLTLTCYFLYKHYT